MNKFTSVDEMSDDQKYGLSKWGSEPDDEWDRDDDAYEQKKDWDLMESGEGDYITDGNKEMMFI